MENPAEEEYVQHKKTFEIEWPARPGLVTHFDTGDGWVGPIQRRGDNR